MITIETLPFSVSTPTKARVMPSKKSSDAIDLRLLEKIQAAGDSGTVQAVVIVQVPAASKKPDDTRGPAGTVIDRVSKKVNEKPVETHYHPRLGGVVVTASGRFISQLLKSKSVVTATASDADIYDSVI